MPGSLPLRLRWTDCSQRAHTHEVFGGRDQNEHPVDLLRPTPHHLPHAFYRLGPAKAYLMSVCFFAATAHSSVEGGAGKGSTPEVKVLLGAWKNHEQGGGLYIYRGTANHTEPRRGGSHRVAGRSCLAS